MKNQLLKSSILFIILMLSCKSKNTNDQSKTQIISTYQPNWASLSQHDEAPEWLQDAKLGIYFHWGVYSVPAFGSEWYPRNMYLSGSREFEYHKNTHGAQHQFGYHHFIPQFTATHFDAEEWAALFQRSGAKFAGPVAQHHDGFALWKSTINPWNAFDKGPKKDITGALAIALRKRNMKLITTFHHARNLQRNADNPEDWDRYNSHYPYHPDYHTSSQNPELCKLYGNIPKDDFHKYWSDQIKEVIAQYHPDIIWFDSWLNFIPKKDIQEMCAYYFNTAEETGQKVAIGYKQSDLPPEVGIQDIEQGGRRDITIRPWMTDVTLSHQSWSYIEGQTYKSAAMVLRNLIDVVSKNGVVLLNISPKADGSIPEAQHKILEEMGQWFSKYGEAIYATRPWDLFGFGTAKVKEGHYGGQSATVQYTANDVRFTQSKDKKSMYLIFLGKPTVGDQVSLRLLARHRYSPHSPIKRIVLLGKDITVDYKHTDTTFILNIPDAPMDELATVFKFELE